VQVIASALIVVLLGASSSWAAFVTTKEAELDAIYGQASFGSNPVDIRFLPTITHVDASLLNIHETTPGNSNLFALFNLFGPSPIHYAYYVDTIDWCGSTNTNIVGCGFQPGNDFVVESSFAAGGSGAELIGHELGHNLNLAHDTLPAGNLMDPSLNGSTTLTPAQVATILARPTIQSDSNGLFIEIQPILILATASVLEPSTMLLTVSVVGVVMCSVRRWRS